MPRHEIAEFTCMCELCERAEAHTSVNGVNICIDCFTNYKKGLKDENTNHNNGEEC